jgi:hypothetical protein
MWVHIQRLIVLALLIAPYTVYGQSAKSDMRSTQSRDKSQTPDKLMKQVNAHVKEMQKTLRFALQRLKEAHDKSDIIQTNCIKDKLAMIKGFLRISEEADVSLREAMISGQRDVVAHEHMKVSLSVDKVRVARTQIEGCLGDMDDPMTAQKKQRVKLDIADKMVEQFRPVDDERTVIIYEPIASERPEAISASE